MRRVVVTGMGILSPLGTGVDHVWQNLIAGKSGIRAVTSCDVSDINSRVAGEVPSGDGSNGTFNADDYVEVKEQKKIDRFILLGMAAAQQAIKDSGWVAVTEEDQWRTGVMVGSGIGGLNEIYNTALLMAEKGPRRISPFFIPASLINLASGHISIQNGFKGPNHAVVTACSTGAHAIGDAMRLIKYGDADVMVAGGTEAAVNRLGIGGFAALRALSTGYNDTPEQASRPFDQGRDGFVIAEGAGVVVLEELEHAKARGAKIYGEVVGYGMLTLCKQLLREVMTRSCSGCLTRAPTSMSKEENMATLYKQLLRKAMTRSCSGCLTRAPTSMPKEENMATLCKQLLRKAMTRSCSGCLTRAPTSMPMPKEDSMATLCKQLLRKAMTRSCSGCLTRAPTSMPKEDTMAALYKQLLRKAMTRSCSGCLTRAPTSMPKEDNMATL